MVHHGLDAVTPLILTFNEEPNIARTLESLRWAARVHVLDSGSTDATEHIARSFPNVHWQQRPFDFHGKQWEYGVRQTGIESRYVLALDADMAVPDGFVEEMTTQFLSGAYAGAITPFEYRYFGRRLWGSLYAPQLRLFETTRVRVTQPGHTQEFHIDGETYHFSAKVIHDDRKPFERW